MSEPSVTGSDDDPLRGLILLVLRNDRAWWTVPAVRQALPESVRRSVTTVRRCLNYMVGAGRIERSSEKKINPMHTGRATVYRVKS